MKILGRTTSKITKNQNVKNVPRLEITEEVLIHCNIVYKEYQPDSRVLYKFVHMHISLKIFLKIFNSEFSYIAVWFTDQNSKPFEIEDKINTTLDIN